jgi:hypothetical protein
VDVEQAAKIVNKTEAGWHVVVVAYPTRALRIIRDDLAITFRIEQLDVKGVAGALTYTWRVISSLKDEDCEAWGPYRQAHAEMVVSQARLKEKLKAAQHEKRMAIIKAQNAGIA